MLMPACRLTGILYVLDSSLLYVTLTPNIRSVQLLVACLHISTTGSIRKMVVCDKAPITMAYACKRFLRNMWYRCQATGYPLGKFPVGLSEATHVINELAFRGIHTDVVRIYTHRLPTIVVIVTIIALLFVQDLRPTPDITLASDSAAHDLVVQASELTGEGGRDLGNGVVTKRDFIIEKKGDKNVMCNYWGRLCQTDRLTDRQKKKGCCMEFHSRKLVVRTAY
jgi:hypothetical protein